MMSSDEERDDDSGNLVMFDDVSSVKDGDIEDNSGSNGEENILLAQHGRKWRPCTSLDNFDPRASTRHSAYFQILGRRDASTEFIVMDFFRLIFTE